MITAKEARQLLDPNKSKHTKLAEKKILEAVEENRESCYVPFSLDTETVNYLKSLGYDVCYCCGSSTLIRW